MKGLLREYEDAQQRLDAIMEDVNYGVESTAYGLDAAATVAAQLVASGMEAGDGMKAALRGISGVAAMTNSTYEDIGRIYTTVAGNGRLMGDQLLQLSSRGLNAAAVLSKSLGKTEAEIRDMVSKGKISFEMFSEAMDKAFGEHAKDANKTLSGILSNIRAALSKIGADFYTPMIEEGSPLIKFLNDVRYRINELRNTLSPITKDITTRLNNFILAIRKLFNNNNLFGYNPFANMIDKIKEIKKVLDTATQPIKTAADAINKAGQALVDYDQLVNDIIMGKWGNAPSRFEDLAAAGYNWVHAQNLVNEKLGVSFRRAEDYVEVTEEAKETTINLTEEIDNLSDEQLRNIGFTEDQVNAIKQLKDMSKKTGIPLRELIDLISQTIEIEVDGTKKQVSAFSTRYLLLNSLKNIGLTLASVFKSVAKAFGDVFNVSPESLFDLIAALHKLTVVIRDRVEKNADKLVRTLRGLFSIIHIITSLIGAGFRIGLELVTGVLEHFNLTILDFTALIGDAIYKFDRWITSNSTMVEIGKAIVKIIVQVVRVIGILLGKLKDLITQNKTVSNTLDSLKNGIKSFADWLEAWVDGLKETDNIPGYIFGGLINGLKAGASKVFDVIIWIGNGIINAIKKVLGIHSPSVVFFAIGGFLIAGLIAGIKDQSISLFDILKGIGNKIIDIFSNLNFSNLVSLGIAAGLMLVVNKIITIIKKLVGIITSFGDLLTGIGNALSGVGKLAKKFGNYLILKGIGDIIKNVAISLLILAGTLFILAKIPTEDLKKGGAALALLAAGLFVFFLGLSKLSNALSQINLSDVGKVYLGVVSIGAGILLMAIALKTISGVEADKMWKSIAGIVVCILGLGALLLAVGKVTNSLGKENDFDKVVKTFTNIGIGMLLMAVALKMMNKVDEKSIEKVRKIMTDLLLLLGLLMTINKFTGNGIQNAANTIKSVGITILLMAIAMKLCAKLDNKAFRNANAIIGTFLLLMVGLMAISKIFKNTELVKVGTSILAVAGAILLMTLACKLLGDVDKQQLEKGIACVTIFSVLIGALIYVAKGSGSLHANTLLGVAACIGIMALSVAILGLIDISKLIKGIVAVGFLSVFIGGLVAVASVFEQKKGALGLLITMMLMITTLIIGISYLATIDTSKLISASTAMISVLGGLSLVMLSLGKLKIPKDGFKTLLKLAGITALFGIILVALSHFINADTALISVASILLLIGGMGLILYGLNKIKIKPKTVEKTIYGLLELVAPLAAIAIVLASLSNLINPETALVTTGSLLAMLTGMTGVLAIINIMKVPNGIEKTILTLTEMAIPLLAMGSVLALLSHFNVSIDIETIAGLTILMTSMTGLLAILGLIGNKFNIKDTAIAVGLLTTMVIPMAAFALVLSLMKGVKKASKNAIALVTLMSACTLLLVPLTAIGSAMMTGIGAGAVLLGIVALAAMAIPLLAFVGIIRQMDGISDCVNKINALTNFMSTMTKCLVTIGLVSPLLIVADAALLGLIGVLGTVALLATLVGGLVTTIPDLELFLDKGITILIKLAEGLGKIAGAFIKGFATTLLSILPEAGMQLSAFMINGDPFFKGLKQVDSKTLKNVKYLTDSLSTLLGQSWINKISSIFNVRIEDLGTKLSTFMTNLKPFISMSKEVDATSAKGVEAIAKALKAITEAELGENMNSVLKKFTGIEGDDIASFAKKLGAVGSGLQDFAINTRGFSNQEYKQIKLCADALLALVKVADEINGLTTWNGLFKAVLGKLTGETVENISTFSERLEDVADGMNKYLTKLPAFSKSNLENIKRACEALETIVGVAMSLTKSVQFEYDPDIFGDIKATMTYVTSIPFEEFIAQLPTLATNLRSVVTNLGDISDSDFEKLGLMTRLLEAFGNIVKLENTSVLKPLGGHISLDKIGEELTDFSESITTFLATLDEIGGGDLSNEQLIEDFKQKLTLFTVIADAATSISDENLNRLTNMSDNMTKFLSGDFKKSIELFNDKDLDADQFKTNFETIVDAYVTATNKLKGLSENEVSSVSAAAELISTLASIDFDNDNLSENTKEYGQALVDFAGKLQEFKDAMAMVQQNDLDEALKKFNIVKDNILEIDSTKIDNAERFTQALEDLSTNGIEAFIKGFNSESTIRDLSDAVQSLIDNCVSKIDSLSGENANNPIAKALQTCLSHAIAYAQSITNDGGSLYAEAEKVGLHVVQGISNGILKNKSIAYSKAKIVGQEAIKGLQAGVDSNSPSKEAMKVGNYVGEGFIIGMKSYSDRVYDSTYSLADRARLGLSNAIKNITNLIAEGIDDDYTIRPVLDLSNIQNGVGMINGMLGSSSIGLNSNLNAISNGMKSFRQNGGTNDVVNAIDNLGRNLSNTGDVYNINGITYEEGTEVSDAIKTLVRAVKIERRT